MPGMMGAPPGGMPGMAAPPGAPAMPGMMAGGMMAGGMPGVRRRLRCASSLDPSTTVGRLDRISPLLLAPPRLASPVPAAVLTRSRRCMHRSR